MTPESSGTVTGEDSASGIPDGIDPSFLAALPENIRQEVIQEQLRLQRIQERAQQQAQAAASLGAGATEVHMWSILRFGKDFYWLNYSFYF